MARGAATHIEHCVQSIYSPSGAASLPTLSVPHSAMSVGEAWNRVTTSPWWPCGNPGDGTAARNVKCGLFHLFVCFTTPDWSVLLRFLSWGWGITIHALLRGFLKWGQGFEMHALLRGPRSWG